jgi:hydroxyacylglutathione hydrolase
MTSVTALPAFVDNYIWMVERAEYAVVVDPGDAAPVLARLAERRLKLAAILATHHHADHVGGVAGIIAKHPAPVYGPRVESARIPTLTVLVDDGDRVTIPEVGWQLEVLAIPGHTRGHVAYHQPRTGAEPPRLFVGDTLFSAGCGRLFEGTPEQMHASLQRLNAFEPETEVYCMHEYTLANLAFAATVEPGNREIERYRQHVCALRDRGLPSLPSRLAVERQVNPFLRVGEPAIIAAATSRLGHAPADSVSTFAALRRWKDGFKA